MLNDSTDTLLITPKSLIQPNNNFTNHNFQIHKTKQENQSLNDNEMEIILKHGGINLLKQFYSTQEKQLLQQFNQYEQRSNTVKNKQKPNGQHMLIDDGDPLSQLYNSTNGNGFEDSQNIHKPQNDLTQRRLSYEDNKVTQKRGSNFALGQYEQDEVDDYHQFLSSYSNQHEIENLIMSKHGYQDSLLDNQFSDLQHIEKVNPQIKYYQERGDISEIQEANEEDENNESQFIDFKFRGNNNQVLHSHQNNNKIESQVDSQQQSAKSNQRRLQQVSSFSITPDSEYYNENIRLANSQTGPSILNSAKKQIQNQIKSEIVRARPNSVIKSSEEENSFEVFDDQCLPDEIAVISPNKVYQELTPINPQIIQKVSTLETYLLERENLLIKLDSQEVKPSISQNAYSETVTSHTQVNSYPTSIQSPIYNNQNNQKQDVSVLYDNSSNDNKSIMQQQVELVKVQFNDRISPCSKNSGSNQKSNIKIPSKFTFLDKKDYVQELFLRSKLKQKDDDSQGVDKLVTGNDFKNQELAVNYQIYIYKTTNIEIIITKKVSCSNAYSEKQKKQLSASISSNIVGKSNIQHNKTSSLLNSQRSLKTMVADSKQVITKIPYNYQTNQVQNASKYNQSRNINKVIKLRTSQEMDNIDNQSQTLSTQDKLKHATDKFDRFYLTETTNSYLRKYQSQIDKLRNSQEKLKNSPQRYIGDSLRNRSQSRNSSKSRNLSQCSINQPTNQLIWSNTSLGLRQARSPQPNQRKLNSNSNSVIGLQNELMNSKSIIDLDANQQQRQSLDLQIKKITGQYSRLSLGGIDKIKDQSQRLSIDKLQSKFKLPSSLSSLNLHSKNLQSYRQQNTNKQLSRSSSLLKNKSKISTQTQKMGLNSVKPTQKIFETQVSKKQLKQQLLDLEETEKALKKRYSNQTFNSKFTNLKSARPNIILSKSRSSLGGLSITNGGGYNCQESTNSINQMKSIEMINDFVSKITTEMGHSQQTNQKSSNQHQKVKAAQIVDRQNKQKQINVQKTDQFTKSLHDMEFETQKMKFSLSQRVLQDLEQNKKQKPQSKHMLFKILNQAPHHDIKPIIIKRSHLNTVQNQSQELQNHHQESYSQIDSQVLKQIKVTPALSNKMEINSTENQSNIVVDQSNINTTQNGSLNNLNTSNRFLRNKRKSNLTSILSSHLISPSAVSHKSNLSLRSTYQSAMNTSHHQRSESLMQKNTSYKNLQIGMKNQDMQGNLTYKQEFHKNVFFPLINNKHLLQLSEQQEYVQVYGDVEQQQLHKESQILLDDKHNSKSSIDASLFQNHPVYQDFEHKMHDYLLLNKLDKAINKLDEELKDDPSLQILEAFQNSTMFQELVTQSGGQVEDNGRIYNLLDPTDLLAYINREIENKEKTYDNSTDVQQISYNRRQIKYLFSSLVERNYDSQMKPEYEKQFQNDLFKQTAQNDYEIKQNLLKKQKKLDLFDADQVKNYYKESKLFKVAVAQEDELKNKIIEFARSLEMDKNKDYEQMRQKFHLTYNFKHKDKINEGGDEMTAKKQIQRFLSEQKIKVETVDHSEQVGRGTMFDSTGKRINGEGDNMQKELTTFNQVKDVDYYYLNNDNYRDDVPFDLYNMVSLAKRIDFKSKLDLNMRDITKEMIKSKFDEKVELNDIQDLARKHLPKEIIEEDGHFYIHSVADNKHQIYNQRKGLPKSKSTRNFLSKVKVQSSSMAYANNNNHIVNQANALKSLSQTQQDDEEQVTQQKHKYNKWYINSNSRFMKEIDLNKQPGIKVFDAQKFSNALELKKSGFIPYFKFGKYTQYDIKQDPELKKAMQKYDLIQRNLRNNEVALVYKEYLSEKKGGDQFLPNYLRKVKRQNIQTSFSPKMTNQKSYSQRSGEDYFTNK
eukprot:403355150